MLEERLLDQDLAVVEQQQRLHEEKTGSCFNKYEK